MSFQGDVGGIGLGELLQSLARSNREGVLTLNGREGLVSTLGIQGGLLFLLPNRDEDGEIWRDRARRAWVNDPNFRVDSLRMSEIARAHRVEVLYQLLDSEGVHFRFEPGALPSTPSEGSLDSEGQGRSPSVHCEGAAVEFLLLEYARIQDETQGAGIDVLPSNRAVPRAMDQGSPPKEYERFFKACDGVSNTDEIADRLGVPDRQAKLMLAALFRSGFVRFAQSRELLVLFEMELREGHFARAAARVSAWCEFAQPGPINSEEAMLLGKEWDTTRLPAMLHSMEAGDARTLLRRLDHAIGDPYTSVVHWTEMSRIFRHDQITRLRLLVWQARDTGDEERPTVRDLLDAARAFRDSGHPKRAGAILRLAAARLPNAIPERLELGAAMITADLSEEGIPWIVEAALTLIGEGDAEKAIAPLRSAVEAAPTNRELRRLLGQARAKSASGRSLRRNSLIALGIVSILGGAALVQIRFEADREEKIAEISNAISEPDDAMRLLEAYFPGSLDPNIESLRETINERRRTTENAARTAWSGAYREAQLEATLGDPLLGLQRTVDLPEPPDLKMSNEPFPLVTDLFNGLAARLEGEINDLGAPVEDDSHQIHTEQRQASLIDDLLEFTSGQERTVLLDEFDIRLRGVHEMIITRNDRRAKTREERLATEKINEQDLMLGAARAHAKAGDWSRALSVYRRLIASDEAGQIERVLDNEMADVRLRAETLEKARALAEKGQHEEARATLAEVFENDLARYLLPWRLESFPVNVHVKLGDGTVRSTPFTVESAFGEELNLTLELEGFESLKLDIDGPANRTVYLSREPQSRWQSKGKAKIEAPPVSVGEDHIVCDRDGKMVRLAPSGKLIWKREIISLGGIARAPVHLSGRPGSILVVTEDGDVWFVDSTDGSLDGPWNVASPPASGPVAVSRGVAAYFADGNIFLWEDRLKPTRISEDEATLIFSEREIDRNRLGADSGLTVLRRKNNEGKKALQSPWTSWSVEVEGNLYHVRLLGSEDPGFKIRRTGEWEYVAWEAPHGRLPNGRLWVSDGEGLRSFQP